MDFTVVKDGDTVKVTNSTDGLCAVRVTNMSDGTTQYKSNINAMGKIANKQTAFTFNIETAAHYMIEAWSYNSSNNKLVPTAVKYD